MHKVDYIGDPVKRWELLQELRSHKGPIADMLINGGVDVDKLYDTLDYMGLYEEEELIVLKKPAEDIINEDRADAIERFFELATRKFPHHSDNIRQQFLNDDNGWFIHELKKVGISDLWLKLIRAAIKN